MSFIPSQLLRTTHVMFRSNVHLLDALNAPIRKVPHELLEQIFEWYVRQEDCHVEYLLFVSRKWRTAALAPSVWSYISLKFPFEHPLEPYFNPILPLGSVHSANWLNYVQHRVQNSKDHRIHIVIRITKDPSWSSFASPTPSFVDLLWDIFFGNQGSTRWDISSRCTVLEIVSSSPEYSATPAGIAELGSLVLPNLLHLEIHSMRAPPRLSPIFGPLGRLETLVLKDTSLNIAPSRSIRHYTTNVLTTNRFKVLNSAAARLITLHLYSSSTPYLFKANMFDFETKIVMPLLETIHLGEDPYVNAILACLEFPALQKIVFLPQVVRVVDSMGTHCKGVTSITFSDAAIFFNQTGVVDMLRNAPDLKALVLQNYDDPYWLIEVLDKDPMFCPKLCLFEVDGDSFRSLRVATAMMYQGV